MRNRLLPLHPSTPGPRPTTSRHPIRYVHVKLTGLLRVTVGHPDQTLAVRGEHGKAVEVPLERQALESRSVIADQIEMKARPAAITSRFHVRGEDDSFAVRMKEGRKVGCPVRCDLALPAPVGIHHIDFEPARFHQSLTQQL